MSATFLTRYLATTLAGETPDHGALVLSCLETDLASAVFEAMPEPVQAEVLRHLAAGEFRHDIPETIEAILIDSVHENLGGPRAAAELINRTTPDTERRVLTALDRLDHDLGEQIRQQTFTFDDITRLQDREIRHVLRETDTRDLAVALRGAKDQTRDRIFANVSEQVGERIRYLMTHDAPAEPSMIEWIQKNIVSTVRQIQQARFTMDRADHDLPV